jgi:hypothetical protein
MRTRSPRLSVTKRTGNLNTVRRLSWEAVCTMHQSARMHLF